MILGTSDNPTYHIEDCRIRLEVASVSREAKMHEKIDTV